MASVLLYAQCLKDILISVLNLAIGSYLPTLKVPQHDLTGKVALVTGANSGIGLSLTEQLAGMGATVYLACRSVERGEAAASEISAKLASTGARSPELHVVPLDNASLASVHALATQHLPSDLQIDYIFHNAGCPGYKDSYTGDGLEYTYQCNFLAAFLLTHLLEARSLLAPAARIIFTSSAGQAAGGVSRSFALASTPNTMEAGFHYSPLPIVRLAIGIPSALYGNTKLMQSALARALQRRFDDEGSARTAHTFSPGYCATSIFEKTQRPGKFWADPGFRILAVGIALAVSVQQGAATGVMLATRVFKEGEAGGFWDRCVRRTSSVSCIEVRDAVPRANQWCRPI